MINTTTNTTCVTTTTTADTAWVQSACQSWQRRVEELRCEMGKAAPPEPERVHTLLLTAAATGVALGHVQQLQSVLLEGRTWQTRATDVLERQEAAAEAAEAAATAGAALRAPGAAAAAEQDAAELRAVIGVWHNASGAW